MDLNKYFTLQEIEAMENYIDKYALEEVEERVADLATILTPWEREKKHILLPMFGNKLILSTQIEFNKPEEEMYNEISSKKAITNFKQKYYDTIDEAFYSDNIPCELNELDALFTTKTLISNVYKGKTFKFINPKTEKKVTIQHNSKAVKAIGKIADAYDIDGYEEFRLEHSRVLNQKKVKGELCISIHPLDYMTMSDNDYNWTSCMNWRQCGCYRQGTVEMMNSPCVVVAYLKGEEPFSETGGSNKKWRELYIVSPNLITNIKGYPYENEELTHIVLDWLKELMGNINCKYTNNLYNFSLYEKNYIPELNKTVSIALHTYNMYNDFRNSKRDKAAQGYYGLYIPEDYSLVYSGLPQCLCCGQEDIEIETEGYLVGSCCLHFEYCDICGDSYLDNNLYEIDGEKICEYCLHNDCELDDIYEESHLSSNLIRVYIKKDEENSYFSYLKIFNEDFNNLELMKEYFKKELEKPKSPWRDSFVYIDDLTEKGKELFIVANGELKTDITFSI